MNIIIPMAGKGSRLRPHTLTTPKPLICVGGKSIVYRLVEDIADTLSEKISEIGFVIGDFGTPIADELVQIGQQFGAKVSIYHQVEALGTAHAVLCAKDQLSGPTIVAYADTLFRADFKINPNDDGILWVKKIDDPSAFGVVELNAKQEIIRFVEKPKSFISDLAMIGVYYFKDGNRLRGELEYLIEKGIAKQGEYQLPDALARLVESGVIFKPGTVNEWLDCGNKEVTVHTNQRVLEFDKEKQRLFSASSAVLEHTQIIQPCFIGENVKIKNSVIGPHVSIQSGTSITDARIQNSLIGSHTSLKNVVISGSMIGSYVKIEDLARNLSVGDYTVITTN